MRTGVSPPAKRNINHAMGEKKMEYASGITQEMIDKAVAFHGHWCGGLATGVRVAAWAMENFGVAADEEIVAVAESDMSAEILDARPKRNSRNQVFSARHVNSAIAGPGTNRR